MHIILYFPLGITVTPLDVVKTRLQAQQAKMANKCFLYCNGLMDHLCPCDSKATFPNVKPIKPLNGTIVSYFVDYIVGLNNKVVYIIVSAGYILSYKPH